MYLAADLRAPPPPTHTHSWAPTQATWPTALAREAAVLSHLARSHWHALRVHRRAGRELYVDLGSACGSGDRLFAATPDMSDLAITIALQRLDLDCGVFDALSGTLHGTRRNGVGGWVGGWWGGGGVGHHGAPPIATLGLSWMATEVARHPLGGPRPGTPFGDIFVTLGLVCQGRPRDAARALAGRWPRRLPL